MVGIGWGAGREAMRGPGTGQRGARECSLAREIAAGRFPVVLSGRVLDEHRQANVRNPGPASAAIGLLSPLQDHCRGSTNALGEFLIGGLMPGKCIVQPEVRRMGFPGVSPCGDMTFDGTNIWFSKGTGNTNMTKMRASDGAVLGTDSSGGISPQGLAFDGAHLGGQSFLRYGGQAIFAIVAVNAQLLRRLRLAPVLRQNLI
jgi:hypothetical protein